LKRQEANQNLGFASRPFVLCGLPIKKPASGQLLHERRNGQFSLQVTGHPSYGLPWGQDRLIPIFLATLAIRQQSQTIQFRSTAEMLDAFGMQQGGTQYRRLVAAFLGIPAKANAIPKGSRTAFRAEAEHYRSVATLAFRLCKKCSTSSRKTIRSEAEAGCR
jgi:hypothetical protein